MDNKCCHQGGPLVQGDIEDLVLDNKSLGPCVSCPWHGWNFKLTSGACTHTEDYSQGVYPCKVSEDNEVLIGFKGFSQDQFMNDIDF